MDLMDEELRSAMELVGDGAMSISDAVRFSGIGRSKLYELMDRGELEYTKVDSRRRIPRRALVKLLAENLVRRAV